MTAALGTWLPETEEASPRPGRPRQSAPRLRREHRYESFARHVERYDHGSRILDAEHDPDVAHHLRGRLT